ncbi:Eukaryotic translation initiation factor 5 [Spraguea lophii 42_110]|uniref:Eukaryotic translation initiation factor 5 n=1 Tax=Spraguea lophii (strain 42_110) TaxID=1358809 RepID=S7XLQ3_SPRLO|nr:Eukaryotic translation initiation factor 5 [Spraguea lophii 42_110]
MLNIDPTITDSFYRYKMPSITLAHEKNNTVLLNLYEISSSLNFDVELIHKYITMELGCAGKIDKNNRIILNGKFDSNHLQKILYNFIENYILCPQCRNPEGKYKIKNNSLRFECLACGCKSKFGENKFLIHVVKKGVTQKKSIYEQ